MIEIACREGWGRDEEGEDLRDGMGTSGKRREEMMRERG